MLRSLKSLLQRALFHLRVDRGRSVCKRSGPKRRVYLAVESLEERLTPAVKIQPIFADQAAQNFFAQPANMAVLQQAEDALTNRLGDSLQARNIPNPGGWTLQFDPTQPGGNNATPLSKFAPNSLDIPADTIPVIIGIHSAAADPQSHGGGLYPGGAVDTRGTSHSVAWFGEISFAVDANGTQPSNFIDTAEHELGHVLGLGESTEWDNNSQLQGNQQAFFTGKNAVAAFQAMGGVVDAAHPGVPLDLLTPGHWAPSPGDSAAANQAGVGFLQTQAGAAIHATMQENTQTQLTALDFAALQDLGWQVSSTAPAAHQSSLAARSTALGLGANDQTPFNSEGALATSFQRQQLGGTSSTLAQDVVWAEWAAMRHHGHSGHHPLQFGQSSYHGTSGHYWETLGNEASTNVRAAVNADTEGQALHARPETSLPAGADDTPDGVAGSIDPADSTSMENVIQVGKGHKGKATVNRDVRAISPSLTWMTTTTEPGKDFDDAQPPEV